MRVAILATLLALSLTAGCTDKLPGALTGRDDGPFTVSPDKGDASTVFHVETDAAGDVTWDFGDGTTASGKSADHKYGFSNGVMTITMIATGDDGKQSIATKTVTLGTGANRNPTVSVSASPSWVEARKTVNLTARGSDADKDPLSYLWTWRSAAGAEEVVLPGSDRTNGVAFDAPGKYVVKVRASDPKGGSSTSETTIDVSKVIPPSVLDFKFNGTLVAGSGGQKQLSEQAWIAPSPAPDTGVDAARHFYTLKYPATTVILLTWNDTSTQGAWDLDLELRDAKSNETVFKSERRFQAGPPPIPVPPMEFNFTQQPPGDYVVIVRAISGAQFSYTLLVHSTLQLTPELVAQAEG